MMLRERTRVALIIVPLALLAIALGGWFYAALAAALLGICAWEYWRMIRAGGYNTSVVMMVAGVVAMILLPQAFGMEGMAFAASMAVLSFMTYHVIAYQRGEDGSATHFTMAVGGLFYIGLLGSYLIALRQLPDGDMWTFSGLTTIWAADTAAYFIGSRYGNHKIAPRVSPKKSWEGYLGGIVVAVIFSTLLAWAWSLRTPQFTPMAGALLGLIVGAVAPLGDFGESMLKRQFGVKDTSNLLPGHGGMLDRLDSTLWAAVISYYTIVIVLIH